MREASRFAEGNVINAGDRTVTVLVRLKQPEVLVLSNVLSDEECLELMRRSEVKLARSTTIDPKTGQEIVVESRSSSGTFFHLHEDDFIAQIDQRLAELLRWPVDHGEGLQILRYAVGGEYRPHFDYFPPPDRQHPGAHRSLPTRSPLRRAQRKKVPARQTHPHSHHAAVRVARRELGECR